MEIQYRPAAPGDLYEVHALVRAAVAAMQAGGLFQWDEHYPDEAVLREDIARGEMRVGVLNGRIAVIYVLNGDGGEEEYLDAPWRQPELPFLCLHRLCVRPDCQHRGVARHTLAHIERDAQQHGAKALRLDVFSRNAHACRLYAAAGFAFVRSADWRMGRFHLMEKYL